MASAHNLPKEQTVTASDLVRHFGEWQERAARAPIYIMNRGRPRLVLTSVSVMDDLCEPHAGDEGAAARAALLGLLDASRELVLLVDADMTVAGLSRSARAHFGGAAQPGVPLATLVRGPGGQFCYDTALRTLASGVPETIEIASEHRPGRRLSVATEPHPTGLVMLIRDVTEQYQASDARAHARAVLDAIGETGATALARLNIRGHLAEPDRSLAAMTGLAQSALADLRFANLIEIGARVAVMEAIEAVLSGGGSRAVDAMLLVARADPLPVQIGLSALREGSGISGVLALIIKRAH